MSRRRAWLTPDTPAPETARCRSISVPDDLLFIGAVTGALLPLTQSENWEEFGSMTSQEAADIMSASFEGFVASECTGGTGECTAPGTDSPLFRRNPITGLWEQWDGGEWVEPFGDYVLPELVGREEVTEAAQKCGAASNAVSVLKTLYGNIIDVYDNEVAAEYNNIEMAAQIAVAIGSAFGPISATFLALSGLAWEVFTQALSEIAEDDWSEEFQEILVCIFNSNASVEDGKVHFDFFNVNADLVGFILPVIDDYVRVRWQVWYLLQCIGAEGLDIAGATTAVQGNCVTCDTWCYTGTPEALGATITQGYFDSNGHAVSSYISGAHRINLQVPVDTTSCIVKRFGFYVGKVGLATPIYTYYQIASSSPSSAVEANVGPGSYYTPDNAAIVSTTNPANCNVYCGISSSSTTLYVSAVTIYGTGQNPFGIGSNC